MPMCDLYGEKRQENQKLTPISCPASVTIQCSPLTKKRKCKCCVLSGEEAYIRVATMASMEGTVRLLFPHPSLRPAMCRWRGKKIALRKWITCRDQDRSYPLLCPRPRLTWTSIPLSTRNWTKKKISALAPRIKSFFLLKQNAIGRDVEIHHATQCNVFPSHPLTQRIFCHHARGDCNWPTSCQSCIGVKGSLRCCNC